MAKLCVGDIPIGAMNWIRTEEVPEERFGLTLDTFIGKVDENGVLRKSTWTGALNFVGVKTIIYNGLSYSFYNCTGITSVDLSSLQTIDSGGLHHAFYGCSGITSVNFSSLITVSTEGFAYAFQGCSKLTSVDFSSLATVDNGGFAYTFQGCSKLTMISFPSLTSVTPTALGSSMFYNCTALTEIHFRADMQSTIETLSGYSDKFGATNATIYFDL